MSPAELALSPQAANIHIKRPALALFDFDGTLTHNDNYSAFLHFATPRWRLALLAPLLYTLKGAWQLGWLSSAYTRRWVTRLCYSGRRQQTLVQLGKRYMAQHQSHIFRPEMLARLRWHQQRGDHIALVSASLDLYLTPWAQEQKITLLCSELAYRHGIATGGYRHGDCANQYKAQRIQQHFQLEDYGSIYAYGDTAEDHAMLALAHHPYLNNQPWHPNTSPR
ncbi:MAG: HAD-IB family hydrolase [Ferrimonas sp.]